MPMYDYRRDLLQIIAQTSDSEHDLKNLSLVLKLVSNLSLSTQNVLSDDELRSFLSKLGIQSFNQSNASKPQLEDSTETTETTEATETAVASRQSELQLQSILDDNQYLVRRMLRGARLIDRYGNAAARINEWLARRFDLKNYDRVTADIKPSDAEHAHELVIINSVDHCHQSEDQNIDYFNLGLIEQVGSQLLVSKSADGSRTLAQANPAFSPYRISQYIARKYSLHAGDIIDLAWYHEAPQTIRIVWKHDAGDQQASTGHVKKHSEYRSASRADANHQSDSDISQLDFDLHGQTVAVIVGDSAREAAIAKIITEHHGHPRIVDGFKASHRSDYYAQAISDADIVITVQNYTNHEVTSAVMTAIAQSDNSQKTAIAHTNSPLMIERAIYRADAGLPAYESAGTEVNYPVRQSQQNQQLPKQNI